MDPNHPMNDPSPVARVLGLEDEDLMASITEESDAMNRFRLLLLVTRAISEIDRDHSAENAIIWRKKTPNRRCPTSSQTAPSHERNPMPDPNHPMNDPVAAVREVLAHHHLNAPSPVARVLGLEDEALLASISEENDAMNRFRLLLLTARAISEIDGDHSAENAIMQTLSGQEDDE